MSPPPVAMACWLRVCSAPLWGCALDKQFCPIPRSYQKKTEYTTEAPQSMDGNKLDRSRDR
eukprot:1066272-Pyramimonas_sp.AAC.1